MPQWSGVRSLGRMIDAQKLSNWYDFQAPFYRLWRDDYDGPLVRSVRALLSGATPNGATGQPGSPRPLQVLDAGCGTGMFSLGLCKADAELELEGLDASEGMLNVARHQAEQLGLRNVRFVRGDVT